MTSHNIHPVRDCVRTWVVAVAIVSVAHEARSQTVAATDWHRGTTLSAFFGATTTSSDTDPAAGVALGWELTPHFTLEGRGMWFEAGPAADAFAAVLGARVPILPARPVVPFLSAGVGLYRATFDGPHGGMPRFYQRRMTAGAAEFPGPTFDDFAYSLGGGVDILLARHLALRPDVTVLVVTNGSDSRVVPVYGIQLAYHFESHPITPAASPTGRKEGAK
jgi:hypothetical protein